MTRTFGFLALVAASLVAASPAQAQGRLADRLDEADANRDGVITRAEFGAARTARFERMDRNRDGAISRDDFGRILRFRPQAGQRLDELLAEADANHDGRVTRGELRDAPMQLFDRADANGDDRIDARERAALEDRIDQARERARN